MKNVKGFILGLIVGLALAISSLAFAQNATQNDSTKAKESCCAMSCCGSGDSCAMKHDSKDGTAKAGCCCCGNDSCEMNMKDKHKEQQKKQG